MFLSVLCSLSADAGELAAERPIAPFLKVILIIEKLISSSPKKDLCDLRAMFKNPLLRKILLREDLGGDLLLELHRRMEPVGVINYCLRLRAQRGNSENIDINVHDPDVTYILDVIRAIVPLIEDGGWSNYTEQHLEIKLFGTVRRPLGDWIYSEVQSKVSKLVRKNDGSGARGATGHLVDYLHLVYPLEH
jgi:hypothetical protein